MKAREFRQKYKIGRELLKKYSIEELIELSKTKTIKEMSSIVGFSEWTINQTLVKYGVSLPSGRRKNRDYYIWNKGKKYSNPKPIVDKLLSKYTKEQFTDLYIKNNCNAVKLAGLFECSTNSIWKIAKHFNVKICNIRQEAFDKNTIHSGKFDDSLKDYTKNQLTQALSEEKSVENLAKKLNISHYLLKRRLSELDIQIKSGPKFKYSKVKEFFNNHTKEELEKLYVEHGGLVGLSKFFSFGNVDVVSKVMLKKGINLKKLSSKIHKVWNKNLTKETDERVKKMAEKMLGRQPHYPKPWYVSKLGHKVRSSLEEEGLGVLKDNNINYAYEKPYLLAYPDGSKHYYYADCSLDNNTIIEFKGYLFSVGKIKLKLFKEQYPNYRVVIITYKELAYQFDKTLCHEVYTIEDLNSRINELDLVLN